MFRLLIGVIVFSFYTNTALANKFETSEPPERLEECRIKLGGGGRDTPWLKLKNGVTTRFNDVGGSWSFIRETVGKCDFKLFNKNNLQGKSANYGTGIKKRLRVGSIGGKDKDGWKVRSLIMTPRKPACYIRLAETGGLSQTFNGPAEYRKVTGWSGVKVASKGCKYRVYNGYDFSGSYRDFTPQFTYTKLDWRIRSIKLISTRRPPTPPPTFKQIKHSNGRCLDIVLSEESNVQMNQCNNSFKSQKWRWDGNGDIHNETGGCLAIADNDLVSGANIVLGGCTKRRTDKVQTKTWERYSAHKIKSARGSFCLDVVNNIDANGTNVQLNRCNATDAQQWEL